MMFMGKVGSGAGFEDGLKVDGPEYFTPCSTPPISPGSELG